MCAGKLVVPIFLYQMNRYCKLLYYFLLAFPLCLFVRLFVFGHLLFFLINWCFFVALMKFCFLFLSIIILQRCTVTDVVTGNLSFAPCILVWCKINKTWLCIESFDSYVLGVL